MPPEVVKGYAYGQKADIWSLGCVLYEVCMFKRPFQHNTREGVYELIQNKNPEQFPKDYSEELRDLCNLMLQKDPIKRPTSLELAKIPYIYNAINSFAEEYDCREFV